MSSSWCDFSDNFAEHWGGGIFANQSTLEVVDSVFRSCRAGFVSTVDDEDLEGTGGGIWVRGLGVWNFGPPAQPSQLPCLCSLVNRFLVWTLLWFVWSRFKCGKEGGRHLCPCSRLRLMFYNPALFADTVNIYRSLNNK